MQSIRWEKSFEYPLRITCETEPAKSSIIKNKDLLSIYSLTHWERRRLDIPPAFVVSNRNHLMALEESTNILDGCITLVDGNSRNFCKLIKQIICRIFLGCPCQPWSPNCQIMFWIVIPNKRMGVTKDICKTNFLYRCFIYRSTCRKYAEYFFRFFFVIFFIFFCKERKTVHYLFLVLAPQFLSVR